MPTSSSSSSRVTLSHNRLPHNAILHASFNFCCGIETGVPSDLIDVGERLSTSDGVPMHGFPQDKVANHHLIEGDCLTEGHLIEV